MYILPSHSSSLVLVSFFFFNDTATTEIYTLSLHDALPISCLATAGARRIARSGTRRTPTAFECGGPADRKSTRLNSSHLVISYAVFCLKKKKHRHSSDDRLVGGGTHVPQTARAKLCICTSY